MTEVVDTKDSGKLVPAAAMTRRAILVGAAASLAAACSPRTDGRSYASAMLSTGDINPAYRRRRVRYDSREKPGTILVDTSSRYLYVVEDGGWATRYGVGVGRDGLALKGNATVGRKAEWPSWTPTANMMNRDPRLLQVCEWSSRRAEQPARRPRAIPAPRRRRHDVPAAWDERALVHRPGHVVGLHPADQRRRDPSLRPHAGRNEGDRRLIAGSPMVGFGGRADSAALFMRGRRRSRSARRCRRPPPC